MQKLEAYAADPKASANQVTELRGQPLKRMRVGDFRVLFQETDEEILVSDLGPRGEIYDRQDGDMNAKIIVTPKGERLAILPAEEYEDMLDALRHAHAIAHYGEGRDEGLTQTEMRALLNAPTPLAFWREKRGLTRAGLARAVEAPEAEIEAVELGAVVGSSQMMAKIAATLKIGVEELDASA
jgi:DNA-binding XRE family transcriptional regulator